MTPPEDALAGVSACIFDAYGTLFDFSSAAEACRDELGANTSRLTTLWRDKQLQYTWLRAAQGRHADFWQVTGEALDFAMEALALDRPGLRSRLMQLYLTPRPFPEAGDVLRRLKTDGIKTAILSNGTPEMLASAVGSAGFTSLLDDVVSVEEVGVFKPHPDVYRHACKRIGFLPEEISFQSANAWDVHGASAIGLRTFWCNRASQPRERLPGMADVTARSLDALPGLLKRRSSET